MEISAPRYVAVLAVCSPFLDSYSHSLKLDITGVAGCSALSNWCMLSMYHQTKTTETRAHVFTDSYGSGSGTSTSGCCGSCCDKSFNEDSFDEQVRRDMEATRDPNAPRPEQMQPAEKMTVTSPKEAADKEDS